MSLLLVNFGPCLVFCNLASAGQLVKHAENAVAEQEAQVAADVRNEAVCIIEQVLPPHKVLSSGD